MMMTRYCSKARKVYWKSQLIDAGVSLRETGSPNQAC